MLAHFQTCIGVLNKDDCHISSKLNELGNPFIDKAAFCREEWVVKSILRRLRKLSTMKH